MTQAERWVHEAQKRLDAGHGCPDFPRGSFVSYPLGRDSYDPTLDVRCADGSGFNVSNSGAAAFPTSVWVHSAEYCWPGE